MWPPHSNSDHQDYYIFSRGSLYTFIYYCYCEGGHIQNIPYIKPMGLEDDFPFSNGWFSYPFLANLGPFKHVRFRYPQKVDEGSDFGFSSSNNEKPLQLELLSIPLIKVLRRFENFLPPVVSEPFPGPREHWSDFWRFFLPQWSIQCKSNQKAIHQSTSNPRHELRELSPCAIWSIVPLPFTLSMRSPHCIAVGSRPRWETKMEKPA